MYAATIHLMPDKSLFPLIIIFVIVLVALHLCVFRPLLRLIDRRRGVTIGEEERAKQIEGASDGHEAEIRYELDMLRTRGTKIREGLRGEAEEKSRELLERARKDREEILARGAEEYEKVKRSASESIESDMPRLKDLIVSKIMMEGGEDE